ncbi:chemotaxis protein CheW [Stratiformator vulcanicus]|uniref:Chemotaxis protein CheW n=1 Tax=Stratiformator vulcanicus TaxID=2527980 RepID=A0A517R1V2_9PLAN|nr:chemotaxis protein CheW [Stratiformator vulcanicus]QDT37823.1 Chemotaxis protein CheW [Stratiformator vulcanicus]
MDDPQSTHQNKNATGDPLPVRQYVSFRVAGQLFGIPVESVQEVLNPQQISRTPKSRSEISGLLNLRGQIVTAVDLRRRLGLAADPAVSPMNVVCRFDEESFSFLVDEVGDVIDLPASSLEPVPGTVDTLWKSLSRGIYQLDHELFLVLDLDAVMSFENEYRKSA